MADKFTQSFFDDFSSWYVRTQKLGDGVSFELRHARNERKVDKRKVIEYKVVAMKNVPFVDDEDTVSALLLGAEDLLAMDLGDEKMYLELVGPDGQVIRRNTRVKSVRALKDAPASTAATGRAAKASFDSGHAGFITLLEKSGCKKLTGKQLGNVWLAMEHAVGSGWRPAMESYYARNKEPATKGRGAGRRKASGATA